ncbi:MAG: hypothetical protein K8R67_09975 [Desulfobacteraceae bacterium]|nr:hypothetical protein [Desulfobacteraceae bacterium]
MDYKKMHKKICKINLLICMLVIMLNPGISLGGENIECVPDKSPNELLDELQDGFKFRMSILSYAAMDKPADSTQNPDNDFLKLSDYSEEFKLRPDASLSFRDIYLSVKPRVDLSLEQFRTGTQKGKKNHEHDIYINEYLIQYQAIDKWFLSYGRQFLQWGPSFLCSPSNPFFFDNGKSQPNQEGEGKEFAELLWIQNLYWTYSLIINTDNGRSHDSDFGKTFALKTDYSGNNGYASLILSYQEGANHKERVGLFGGLTVSDALILYGEANFQKGLDVLYPTSDNSPINYSMNSVKHDDCSIYSTLLVGGTYTFESGSSLTCEYLYNQMGYNNKEASDYYKLRQNAHDAYNLPNPLAGLAKQALGQTADNGLMFVRQNYFMLQYIENDIFNIFNLTLRWTQCIDDKSAQLVSLVDFYAGDNTRFFASGILNIGGHESAFGSMLDYQTMIGIEYIF